MKKNLRILLIEDVPADAELIQAELRKTGLAFRLRCVENRAELLRELQNPPDLILSDHGLPQFDGFTALALSRDQCPDVPFIFVTGAMGEENAVETLKCGATDYVLKDHLTNLGPAINRALRRANVRRLHREAESALRESEERFRMLVEGVKDYALIMLDADGYVSSWNSGAKWIFGYSDKEIIGHLHSVFYPADELERGGPAAILKAAIEEGRYEGEVWRVRQGGAPFWANVVITALHDARGRLRGFATVTRDITERRRAADELRRSEARHTAILDAAFDAIISVDQQGIIREWNPAAEHLFAYTRSAALGRKMDDLIIPSASLKIYRDGLANYLITGVGSLLGRPIELTARRANGSEFVAELTITPIPGAHPALYTSVIRDITARKQAEAEILRLNVGLEQRVAERTAELEAANRDLEAFSYSVSHDLRAPLRHINGFIGILHQHIHSTLNAEDRGLLANIERSAERMGVLIDNLLAFARLGLTELRKTQVSLDELTHSVIADLAQEIRPEVVWKIGPLPQVRADPALLRQVISNLVSNALKYTRPRAEPHIEIDARESASEVVIRVSDNGVGFDTKYSNRLFGVFQRLHRESEFEGTGIGLANVRRIVQRHGGNAWAESIVDNGASFFFSLPR